MSDSAITIISILALMIVLKLAFAYMGALMRFINRYTFNIIPNVLGFFGDLFGKGLSIFVILAFLAGYSTGFIALYQGTSFLIRQIDRQISSEKVMGKIIDVDNSPNMSDALVEFTDKKGATHEFVYTASYNGTTFHVGDIVPVYYLPSDIIRSATLSISGGYVVVGFFYFYGFAVSGFFVFMVYSRYRQKKRVKDGNMLEDAPIYLKVPVSKLLPVNEDVIIQLDYKDPLTRKQHHFFSQNIRVSEAEKILLESAFFTVQVNPKNYQHYEFDTVQIDRVLGRNT